MTASSTRLSVLIQTHEYYCFTFSCLDQVRCFIHYLVRFFTKNNNFSYTQDRQSEARSQNARQIKQPYLIKVVQNRVQVFQKEKIYTLFYITFFVILISALIPFLHMLLPDMKKITQYFYNLYFIQREYFEYSLIQVFND